MDAVLYVRDPADYDPFDPLDYAAELGCKGVALQPRIRRHREMVSEAVARFGGEAVMLYDLPSEYTPEKWRPTLNRAYDLASVHGCGILADCESDAPSSTYATIGWNAATSEAVRFGEALAQMGNELAHVGLTTFPRHSRRFFWAEIARRYSSPVYSSVQLYGAGFPRSSYESELREWKAKWLGGCFPSIALGTWRRNPMEPAEYLRYLEDVKAAMKLAGIPPAVFLWHGVPPMPGEPKYEHMRAWLADEPAPELADGEGTRAPRSKGALFGALAALGAAGLAAAYYLARC